MIIRTSFSQWKDVIVFPAEERLTILPAKPLAARQSISPRILDRLIHPDRSDQIQVVEFIENDAKIIASTFPKNTLQVWDRQEKRQLTSIRTPAELKSSDDFWLIRGDRQVLTYHQSRGHVQSVEDGDRLGVKVEYPESAIQSWDRVNGRFIRQFQTSPVNLIRGISLSPDQRYLMTNSFASGTFFDEQPRFIQMYDFEDEAWKTLPRHIEYPALILTKSDLAVAYTMRADMIHTKGIGVFHFPSFELIHEIKLTDSLARSNQLFLSQDEKHVFASYVTSEDSSDWSSALTNIAVINIEAGELEANQTLPKGDLITFVERQMSNGTIVYSKRDDRKTYVTGLEPTTLDQVWVTDIGEYDLLRNLVIEPNGQWLAAICYPDDSHFGIRNRDIDWDLVAQSELVILDQLGSLVEKSILPVGASTLALTKEGDTGAVGGVGSVYLIDLSDLIR